MTKPEGSYGGGAPPGCRTPARLAAAMRTLRIVVVSLVLASPTFASCVTVHPYEREYLARPAMDLSGEGGESAFRAHVHDSREGATGGHGSTGGGCGCN